MVGERELPTCTNADKDLMKMIGTQTDAYSLVTETQTDRTSEGVTVTNANRCGSSEQMRTTNYSSLSASLQYQVQESPNPKV